MEPNSPILLILDLDETLIYASEQSLGWDEDFVVGSYSVYLRPHLAEFLTTCAAGFRLAIWSTATDAYVRSVVPQILPPDIEPVFIWGRSRCVRSYNHEEFEEEYLKDLKKVKRLGYGLKRVLIADDTPRKVRRHYGNAVYVPPFFGDPNDDTLPGLANYLLSLRDVGNVRRVEKRGWARAEG